QHVTRDLARRYDQADQRKQRHARILRCHRRSLNSTKTPIWRLRRALELILFPGQARIGGNISVVPCRVSNSSRPFSISHIAHIVKAYSPRFESRRVCGICITDIEMDTRRKRLPLTVCSAGFNEATLDTEGRVHEPTVRAF